MIELPQSFTHVFETRLLEEMRAQVKIMTVAANQPIMAVGQDITVMPIVLNGVVKVSRINEEGQEILLYYINPMEGCAMTFTSCMQHKTSEVEAVTEGEVDLMVVPVNNMDLWMNKFPSWKNFVMENIQNRFDEMIKAIDQLAFQKLDDRLIYYLKEKSKATGSALINHSHEQIASELATSRVVISRLLKKLEKDERVVLYRNQIKLLHKL